MNPEKKITVHQQVEEEQSAQTEQQAQRVAGREFGSVEELLRHDADSTPVPATIAQRLQESLSRLPPPPRRAWWRRIFGGPSL